MLSCATKGLEMYLLSLCAIFVKEVAQAAWPLVTSVKGTVRPDQISLKVIPLYGIGIGHQPLII